MDTKKISKSDLQKSIDNADRNKWGSQAEFLLSCVGYSVGLGNIWRFPYLCMQNGGGAFLIPYFTSLFMCGMPLFCLEMYLGQFSGTSALEVWEVCPALKGVGYGMLIVSWMMCLYYNVIISWVLYYLFKSFALKLPWSHCGNWWNTPMCLQHHHSDLNYSTLSHYPNVTHYNDSGLLGDVGNISITMNMNVSSEMTQWKSAAEEFWQHGVLQLSPDITNLGGIIYELLACFLIAWVLVFLCLCKGIQTSGKVVYVTATAPYLLLTALLIRGVTLPGAIDGIKFYIIPEWSKLLEFKIWAIASLQVFFSLAPCWGGIITYSSYNKFHNNFIRDAVFVPVVTGLTSLYGGFVIFSVIGFIAQHTGTTVQDFIKSGPGLAFIAYPEALTEMPIPPLWSILFFLMLLTVGLDSMFGTFETITTGLEDRFPILRRYKIPFTASMCFFQAGLGIIFVSRAGIYYFQIIDWYCGAFSVMIFAVLECVCLSWCYGIEKILRDIDLMIGYKPCFIWKVCWCFITPAMIMVILVYNIFAIETPKYGNYEYPNWAIGFGWCVAMISVIPVPIFILKEIFICQKGTLFQRIKNAFQPTAAWRPAFGTYGSRSSYTSYTPTKQTEL